MDQDIILHQQDVAVSKKNTVTLKLIVPGQVKMDYLRNYVHSLSLETNPDNLYFPKDHGCEDQQPTTADLTHDQVVLSHWLLSERANWEEVFAAIDRKKNGTFAIGRVVRLHRVASSETGYSEESFGFYGDELRIKTIDDQTAVLRIEQVIRKYDEPRYSRPIPVPGDAK